MAKVVLEGVAATMKKFERATTDVQNKVTRKAQRTVAKDVRDSAKAYAPIEYGTLQDSIKVRALRRSRKNKDIVGVRVITGDSDSLFRGETFYGGFQEIGTVHMEPNPFMLPAMLENEGTAYQKFTQAVNEAIAEMAAK